VAKLVPIELEDGMVLYIEAEENTETAPISAAPVAEPVEQGRTGSKGGLTFKPPAPTSADAAAQSMKLVQSTIRTYAYYCMTAFKNFGAANVDEVTLEFGVNLSADAGIPYIAKGKAESNLKITVRCTYPQGSQSAEANGNGQAALRS
jgi:hypothetical protein